MCKFSKWLASIFPFWPLLSYLREKSRRIDLTARPIKKNKMLQYILPILVPMCVWFGMIDGPSILAEKYAKWLKLNKLVATQNKNSPWKTAWISGCMIAETMWTSSLQLVNNTVRKIGRTDVEVSYVVDGKMYKMVTSPVRGPCPIVSIVSEKGENVTERILPYYGPRRDWHHRHYSPQFFGHKQLVFTLAEGHEKVFDETERIGFS